MILQTSSALCATAAARKVFLRGELHVTRRCESDSVLILMERGILRFREDGAPVVLRAGEYYVQRPGLLQEGLPCPPADEDPAVYVFVHFAGGDYAPDGAGIPLRGTFRPDRLRPFLEEISQARDANRFRLTARLFLILAALADGSPDFDRSADLPAMIRAHIEASYASPLSLADLSRRFGYHPDHLSRVFRARYGTTIHRYLTDYRMDRAREILRATSASLASVAPLVGYRDPSAFYRAYTAHTGSLN